MGKSHILKYPISIIALCFFFALSPTSHASDSYGWDRACTKTAKFLKYSCGFDTRDDYLESVAICFNEPDKYDKNECFNEARESYREDFKDCRKTFRARKDVCANVGEAPYDPPFGEDFADNFVDPSEIGKSVQPNLYLPLVIGNRWVYEGTLADDGDEDDDNEEEDDERDEDDEGDEEDSDESEEEELETVTITVTDQTKLIDGVTCITVTDVVKEDEIIVETTEEWYAQDIHGNIWTCGEIAKEFELFDGDEPELPELVDTEGSWKVGRDRAKAGIAVPSIPEVGEVLRQEAAWGESEDVIEVISINATEIAPAAYCNNECLQINESTPLDTEETEDKYYAPQIGLIVEIDLESGERLELIEFTSK